MRSFRVGKICFVKLVVEVLRLCGFREEIGEDF